MLPFIIGGLVALGAAVVSARSGSSSSGSSYDYERAERERRALLKSQAQQESVKLLDASLRRWGVQLSEEQKTRLVEACVTEMDADEQLMQLFPLSGEGERLVQQMIPMARSADALAELRAQLSCLGTQPLD
jgi:recombinational DNA repair ATPase RecF